MTWDDRLCSGCPCDERTSGDSPCEDIPCE